LKRHSEQSGCLFFLPVSQILNFSPTELISYYFMI